MASTNDTKLPPLPSSLGDCLLPDETKPKAVKTTTITQESADDTSVPSKTNHTPRVYPLRKGVRSLNKSHPSQSVKKVVLANTPQNDSTPNNNSSSRRVTFQLRKGSRELDKDRPLKRTKTTEASGATTETGTPVVVEHDISTRSSPNAMIVPTLNDVGLGTGNHTTWCPGNAQYDQWLLELFPHYLRSNCNERPAIARRLVERVNQHGGRFLERVSSSEDHDDFIWRVVSSQQAEDACLQALVNIYNMKPSERPMAGPTPKRFRKRKKNPVRQCRRRR